MDVVPIIQLFSTFVLPVYLFLLTPINYDYSFAMQNGDLPPLNFKGCHSEHKVVAIRNSAFSNKPHVQNEVYKEPLPCTQK